MLLELSVRLSEGLDLRKLATIGLKIAEHKIDGEINSNKSDTRKAALAILKNGHKTQTDSKAAYCELCRALKQVGLAPSMKHFSIGRTYNKDLVMVQLYT